MTGTESGLGELNRAQPDEARIALLTCCGSPAWASRVAALRPYESMDELLEVADRVWWGLAPEDWLEAFRSHPRIGERKAAGQTAREQRWSAREQSAAAGAGEGVAEALAAANLAYEARFGHIYIVCASGRGADEILADLRSRMRNDPATELRVAAEEQRKITRLRLARLLEEPRPHA